MPNLWFVDGEAYDLTEFLPHHPGGARYLAWPGNDVSITFNTYHKNPARNKAVLQKYKVDPGDVKPRKRPFPKSAKFLFAEDFDARIDIKTYNFDPDNKDLFLNECRSRILKPEVQRRIKELDVSFDRAVAGIGAFYLCFSLAWFTLGVPWYISTPVFAALRTALAGAGHYFTHRPQPFFWSCLFDVNYIGASLTLIDGHNVGHHAPTMSRGDPKTGFFGAIVALPRLVRVPAYTVHKLGHFFTGMFIKGVEVHTWADSPIVKFENMRNASGERLIPRIWWSHWLVHLLMVGEFVLAYRCGLLWSWFAQFFLTLWLNTLMVVSSHDFECQVVHDKDTDDWGKFQLMNCLDLTITGNPWVDVFLSAGLSPHRAHHIFPYQRSGWANIYSTDFVRASAEKFGYRWEPPRSLQFSRLPSIFKAYIMGPLAHPLSRRVMYDSFIEEHCDWQPYWHMVKYIVKGFTGIGSL
mmetsp:Transcript_28435/g.71944  ORF Transcript_28435/g.71944 Transcript_28435/m.71944 type:complete len:466 (-) Transcript_28435:17-1414(-)